MSKKKTPPEQPPALEPRPGEERRRRFAWVDDDVLHLEVDGEDVKSTPPDKQD